MIFRATSLAAAIGGCAVLVACAGSNTYPAGAPTRPPAAGTPARFVNVPPQAATVPPDTLPGSGCLNPMYDLATARG